MSDAPPAPELPDPRQRWRTDHETRQHQQQLDEEQRRQTLAGIARYNQLRRARAWA